MTNGQGMRRIHTLIAIVMSVAGTAGAQVTTNGSARPTAPRDTPAAVRTGIVRGRALTPDGMPVRRAQIQLTTTTGAYRNAATDDGGRYEFRDAPAGQMLLSARKPGYVVVPDARRTRVERERRINLKEGATLDGIDFLFIRGGVAAGRVFDEAGEPVIGATVQLARSRYVNGQRSLQPTNYGQTDDRGEFRLFGIPPGEYYLSARHQIGSGSNADNGIEYATTYFPGTAHRAEAQRVAVSAGAEIAGLSIPLQRTRSARIRGVVQGPTQLIGKIVSARLKDGDSPERPSDNTDPDGSFVLSGVVPGTYILTARDFLERDLSARTEVTVTDADVSGVVLTLRPGVKARGRITFDESPTDIRPADVRVFAAQEEEEFTRNEVPPTAREDWTFELTGLAGPHRLVAGVLSNQSPWGMKSVRLADVDVTDTGIDFRGDDVENIEIQLTRKRTVVTGLVRDSEGRPVTDTTIVLFSDDQARWGARTRYIGVAHPDQTGRYTIEGHPPGRYRVIALGDVEEGEDRDPDLLNGWRTRAATVDLGEGETRTLDLKLMAR
jgi:protocatechuate 3,4-dioxygenase beta subunit